MGRISEDRDQNQQIEEEFPGRVRLTETTNPDVSIESLETYSDIYHPVDSGFNVYNGIYLDQYHTFVRGHDPASVGFEPWSPAAWCGG